MSDLHCRQSTRSSRCSDRRSSARVFVSVPPAAVADVQTSRTRQRHDAVEAGVASVESSLMAEPRCHRQRSYTHLFTHTHTHTQTIVLLPSTNTCKTSVIQKHHNVNHPIFFYIKWDKTLTQSINAECLSTTFLVYPVLGQALSLNSTYLGFV